MFSANFNDAPRLYNYEAASRHEAIVKPIRGRPDCKPLGNRRKTHVTIRRGGEAVICKLHHTDVLTYHPDGRIVLTLDGWATQSTCAFVTSLLGRSVGLRHNRVWIDGVVVHGVRGCFPLHTHDENILRKVDGVLHFDNPAATPLHRVNRTAVNTVRRIYKPFKDYLNGVLKVRDAGFSEQELGDTFGWVREGVPMRPTLIRIHERYMATINEVSELLALTVPTADPDETNANFYKASLWLARCTTYSRPSQNEAMFKLLDDCILLKHRDECFQEFEAEPGKVARDAYSKFF